MTATGRAPIVPFSALITNGKQPENPDKAAGALPELTLQRYSEPPLALVTLELSFTRG